MTFWSFMRLLSVLEACDFSPETYRPKGVHPWRWQAMVKSHQLNAWTYKDFTNQPALG